jgi:sugar phosphate isomerase/epimerase
MPDLPLGAVIAFNYKDVRVADQVEIFRAAGVRRVQVFRDYMRSPEPGEILETLRRAAFTVDSLHGYFHLEDMDGPPCDISAADAAEREAALEIMEREADFARALGCRDVVVHPTGARMSDADAFRPAMLEESARDLAAIGRTADVRFLVENMPPTYFGCDVPELRRIVDAVDDAHLGLIYDSGHANMAGDPVGVVRAMGPRLWGVHLHDNLGENDDHMIPGTGTAPLEAIAAAMAEVGYGGTFLLEVYRPMDEVRRDLTAARLEFIERLRRIASGESPEAA